MGKSSVETARIDSEVLRLVRYSMNCSPEQSLPHALDLTLPNCGPSPPDAVTVVLFGPAGTHPYVEMENGDRISVALFGCKRI